MSKLAYDLPLHLLLLMVVLTLAARFWLTRRVWTTRKWLAPLVFVIPLAPSVYSIFNWNRSKKPYLIGTLFFLCALGTAYLGPLLVGEYWVQKMCREERDHLACFSLGLKAEHQGNVQLARQWYGLGCNTSSPDRSSCEWALSLALKEEDKNAIKTYSQLLCELDDTGEASSHGWHCRRLADLLMGEGDKKAAKSWYRRACKREDWEACFSLGELEEESGDILEARAHFSDACKNHHSAACWLEGTIALQLGEKQQAELIFARLCEEDDKLGLESWVKVESCFVRGILEEEKGRLDDARQWYLTACDRKSGGGCSSLGLLTARSGKRDEAVKLWEKACNLNDSRGCFLRAVVANEDQIAERKRYFSKACEKKHAAGCKLLALIEKQLGNEAAASTALARSREFYNRDCSAGNNQACQYLVASSKEAASTKEDQEGLSQQEIENLRVVFRGWYEKAAEDRARQEKLNDESRSLGMQLRALIAAGAAPLYTYKDHERDNLRRDVGVDLIGQLRWNELMHVMRNPPPRKIILDIGK